MAKSDRINRTVPMYAVPQLVPSHVCLSCDVCCRFPERTSQYRPFFSQSEIQEAIAHGIDAKVFSNLLGSQVEPVPHPFEDGYLCPAFDPQTSHCRIYNVRPLDCQIYPFVIIWDRERHRVHLGWDIKCPFLRDQTPWPHDALPASSTPVFPDHIQHFIQSMAEKIESAELGRIVSNHPQLVMEFQEDVIPVHPLPRLTQQMTGL